VLVVHQQTSSNQSINQSITLEEHTSTALAGCVGVVTEAVADDDVGTTED
jgi:hypothetical protein